MGISWYSDTEKLFSFSRGKLCFSTSQRAQWNVETQESHVDKLMNPFHISGFHSLQSEAMHSSSFCSSPTIMIKS